MKFQWSNAVIDHRPNYMAGLARANLNPDPLGSFKPIVAESSAWGDILCVPLQYEENEFQEEVLIKCWSRAQATNILKGGDVCGYNADIGEECVWVPGVWAGGAWTWWHSGCMGGWTLGYTSAGCTGFICEQICRLQSKPKDRVLGWSGDGMIE